MKRTLWQFMIAWTAAGGMMSATASGAGAEDARTAYGTPLTEIRPVGIGKCADAAVSGDRLYAIGNGNFYVFDLTRPDRPRELARLGGLGMTRQLRVQGNRAYVTSREDGMFILDVARPERPRLLSHYDTIEMATGIEVAGEVAFVACRNYGVELVDVGDPEHPRHISTVRTGEAQSVAYRDGYLYVGVWAASELVICEVKKPASPRIVARVRLDGYGDGVFIRDRYCLVATGHHARGGKGHGHGHGMEVVDISDPVHPRPVSRVKAPPFYGLGHDMWDVAASGPYAYLGDTWNGFFIIDISKIDRPVPVARVSLPPIRYRGKQVSPPVYGFAVTDGYVYLAGGLSDLYVVKTPLARRLEERDETLAAGPSGPPAADRRFRVYRPDGQVYAASLAGDVAWVAAGRAGLHAVRFRPELRKLAEYPTGGVCQDVKAVGDRVYAAEGKGGLTIWRKRDDARLEKLSTYRVDGAAVKQVVVPPPGRYALIQVAATRLQILDVSDPVKPELVLDDQRLGLLYGYQIADGLLDGRYAACFWHVSGFYWYDLAAKPKPRFSGDRYPFRISPDNGMAFYRGRALLTCRNGKYALLDRQERRPEKDLPQYGVPGVKLCGKPTVFGDRLYVANRIYGGVYEVDIGVIGKPRLLRSFQLEGNPGLVSESRGTVVIPAGYQGLLVVDGKQEP